MCVIGIVELWWYDWGDLYVIEQMGGDGGWQLLVQWCVL